MSYLCTVASLTFSLAQRSFFVYLLLSAAKACVVFLLSTGIAGGFCLIIKNDPAEKYSAEPALQANHAIDVLLSVVTIPY